MKEKELVLKVDNVSKQYRLGLVGTGTLKDDLKRWSHRIRGKEDPFLKIGAENDRSKKTDDKYVWALKDIGFEVKRGEVLGIIGKNGAGKSTLLKLLSKVADPTTGSIKYKGRIAALLEVGTGFHPELTGRENIFLNGAVLGMNKAEIAAKVDEIIEFSGVAQYVDTPVKRYSSGMTVRLGFAIAAHLEPDILIIDEVLAVGDAEFQKKCIGKMQDVAGEGRTVLFVSHNMVSVENLCHTSIVLENGKIIYKGTAVEGINHYLNRAKEDSSILLKDRVDRIGNGKVQIEEIIVHNENNKPVNLLNTGKSYKILFKYRRNDVHLDSKIIFMVHVKNDKDILVSYLSSDERGQEIIMDKETGIIAINIDKLQLRGGAYMLDVRVSEKRSVTDPHTNLDFIQNAFQLDIETGDYWDSGFLNRPGGFIQDFDFECL